MAQHLQTLITINDLQAGTADETDRDSRDCSVLHTRTHTHASNHLLPSANTVSLMSQVVVADKLYRLYFVKQLSRVDETARRSGMINVITK